ncbi:MAG: sugar nucleotide-binding protein [Ruthenibacterium sp.]
MKIVITGANGQLGTELQKCLDAGKTELGPLPERLLRATVIATDLDTLDITNRHEVATFVRHHQPDAIDQATPDHRHQLCRVYQCGRMRNKSRCSV